MKTPAQNQVLVGADGFVTYRNGEGSVVEQQLVEIVQPPSSPEEEFVLISENGRILECKFMKPAEAEKQNKAFSWMNSLKRWVTKRDE